MPRSTLAVARPPAHFRQAAIMLDGDEAGRNAATEMATRPAHTVWVRIAVVAEGTHPDHHGAQI